ncbi:hypothetical protein P3W45_000983 [Vairimorpha bombi]
MSDINSKLIKYKNLNLIKYLNETLPAYEKSILYTYENVYRALNELKDISTDLKKINLSINYKEKDKVVNKKKLLEFRSLVPKFSTDISSFDTGERYLEYFDFFSIKNDKYVLLMTNDILIIGRVIEDTRMYQLVNAFNYAVIDVKCKERDITIKISQSEMTFYGEADKIRKFYEIFRELSYSYEDSVTDEVAEKDTVSADLIEYLMYTEKYDSLTSIDAQYIDRIQFYDKQKFIKFIKCLNLKGLVKEANIFVTTFLRNTCKNSILKINKIKPLLDLIEDVFSFYHRYYNQQKELIKEIHEVVVLDNIKIILLYENQILDCFKYFEKRIFSKRFYCKTLDEMLGIIKGKCKFDGNDFSYLVDYFEDKNNEQKIYFLDKAKLEIKKMIEESLH